MKRSLILVAAVALVAAGCGGTRTVIRTVTVSDDSKTGPATPLEIAQFGYLRWRRASMRRGGFDGTVLVGPVRWSS